MASLDEELGAVAQEEQERKERLEAFQQQEYLRQQTSEDSQGLGSTVQNSGGDPRKLAAQMADKHLKLGEKIGTILWIVWLALSFVTAIPLIITGIPALMILNLMLYSPKLVYRISEIILDFVGVGEVLQAADQVGLDKTDIKIKPWQKTIIVALDSLLIAIPIMLVMFIYSATCGNSWISFGTKVVNIASLGLVEDFCAAFGSSGGRSGGGGATGSYSGLDITITSAYRPGSVVQPSGVPSAHGRGEAVDIALRNPTVPVHGTDPRIAQLIQIAQSAGFTGQAGDTVDEYANPTCEGQTSCGGHVHVEFNLIPNGHGRSFCDNGPPVANPPIDLVPIPSNIPVAAGTSDRRVRSCLLGPLEQIFIAAQTPLP